MLKNAKNLKQIDPVTVDGVPYEAYELQDIPAEEWNAIADRHNAELVPMEFSDQRILTTQQLADGYETTARRISENFNRNQEYYTVGKHYYCLKGADLKDFKSEYANCGIAENVNIFYLWTERGALLHAKSLNTQKAWDVYDMLVDTYFRVRQLPALPETATPVDVLTARVDKLIALLEQQSQQPLQIEQKPTAKYDMNVLKQKKMLSKHEAAFYLGVCNTTMHNIMHSITFPALVRVGSGKGRVLVNREVFDTWIDTRTGSR